MYGLDPALEPLAKRLEAIQLPGGEATP